MLHCLIMQLYKYSQPELVSREERPEHRNQDYGYDEAYDYQTGTAFYVVHKREFARA